MATQGVVPMLIFLLKVGVLLCNTFLPYSSEGLPQLSDVLFPDFKRDPATIRTCQQQGGRNCPGLGGGNPQLPRLQQQGPQSCRRGVDAASQQRLLTGGGSSAAQGCDLLQGNVLWPGDTSRCAQVLSQGPCGQGQWVILSNNIDGETKCASRPCMGSDKVLMNGQCYHVNDNSMCPPTMTLQTNEFGNGECECPAGKIYHRRSNRCYTPYSRGPCLQGQIIKVVDAGDRGTSQCIRNPCPEENMAPLNQLCFVETNGPSQQNQCYRINSVGPCSNGILSIDGTSAEPGCSDRSIFDHQGFPCRVGSMRDQAGRCRRVFRAPRGQPQRCRNNEIRLGLRCIERG